MATALPPAAPRRVTYVLPAPTGPVPVLSLPPPAISKRGHQSPLYSVKQPAQLTDQPPGHPAPPTHPSHRLPVQALALDLSTPLASTSSKDNSPQGLLYTGGRDGLLCSWELGLPTRRRRRPYGRVPAESDSDSGSDGEDDPDYSTDRLEIEVDGLENRPVSVAAARKQLSAPKTGGRPRALSGASGRTNNSCRRAGAKDVEYEATWEVDDERVRQMAEPPKAKFRQCIQSHTDWINDIVLCNYNRTLISASSDSLILAWNPHSSSHEDQMVPTRIGRHSDYVRCLAGAREANWVASGGFDRKIKLWDVQEGRSNSVLEMPSPPASIYSLAATRSGHLLAAGTPERVIRCWDPRSKKQVARLGGHTDNVRALVFSEEGKWLLSASSDSTVKLWSLTAQKLLHTFSHHSASAWSLFSQHPELQVFYSGDRDGNVCKIDIENTADPGEGECIVLARDGPDDPLENRRGCEGITQLVAQDDAFVWTAGGSSSVKRWRDVPTRTTRAGGRGALLRQEVMDDPGPYESTDSLAGRAQSPDLGEVVQPERERAALPTVSFLAGLTTPLSRTTSVPSPRSPIGAIQSANRPSSLRVRASPSPHRPLPAHHASSGLSAAVSHPSLQPDSQFDIPYDSLVPLTSPDDSYFSPAFAPRRQGTDGASIYSVSGLSIPGFGSTPVRGISSASFGRSPQSVGDHGAEADGLSTKNFALREFNEREAAAEATPLRSEPDDVILGTQGLARCELLSDRRHALTFAAEDDHHAQSVALWDIVTGRCLGEFAPDEVSAQARSAKAADAASQSSGAGSGSAGSSEKPADVLEFVRERIEGEASTLTWCKVDCRVGALSVHLEEARVFDAEVYADEAELDPSLEFPPDHRLSYGKWVLRQLFDGFIEAELELRAGGGTPKLATKTLSGRPLPPNFISLSDLDAAPATAPRAGQKTPGMTIGLATPAPSKVALPEIPKELAYEAPRNEHWNASERTEGGGTAASTPKPHGTPFGLGPLTGMTSVSNASGGVPGSPGARTPTLGGGGGGADYFSLPPTSGAPESSASTALAKGPDGRPSPLPTPAATPSAGTGSSTGGMMGRLRNLGKTSKRPVEQLVPIPSGQPIPTAAPEEVNPHAHLSPEEQHQLRVLEQVLSLPITPAGVLDAPPIRYPEDLAVMISEETSDGAAWSVSYRGLVGTGREDLAVLEQKAPQWVLEFVLGNRVISKEPPKISFMLQPWRDPASAGLPDLPNANARLTANRSLRSKKALHYVADKLDLRRVSRSRAPSIHGAAPSVESSPVPEVSGGEEGEEYDPEAELEVLCGDVLIPGSMTLGTVRAFYWKGGGDVVLQYRVKGGVGRGEE